MAGVTSKDNTRRRASRTDGSLMGHALKQGPATRASTALRQASAAGAS